MTCLDADQIRASISGRPQRQLDQLEVFAEIPSTNSYLMTAPAPEAGRYRVALAEHQTAGRGQRDRRWHSPESTGLCMSLAYTFRNARDDLSSVTLAAGVGVVKALAAVGVPDVRLKWPNDLILGDGKLGGILTEVRGQTQGDATIVIGVGINIDLGDPGSIDAVMPSIGRVTDLASSGIVLPCRNELSARIIELLFASLTGFEEQGFLPFANEYEKRDWLRGRTISVAGPLGTTDGVADGVEADGSLVVCNGGGRHRVASGQIQFVSDGPAT